MSSGKRIPHLSTLNRRELLAGAVAISATAMLAPAAVAQQFPTAKVNTTGLAVTDTEVTVGILHSVTGTMAISETGSVQAEKLAIEQTVDERDRGPHAHRRQAAEGQGARGSGEQRQEPSRRGLKPRVAHAAQCHPWLLAIAGTRPGASVAAGRRRQGRAPERGAPVGADRRAARHIEDRSGTFSPQPQ